MMTHDEKRRDPRYELRKNAALAVTVRYEEDGLALVVPGEASDLSLRGAKLKVPRRLQRDQPVEIEIFQRAINVKVATTAKACWVRPHDADNWLVGFAFEVPFTLQDMTQLAKQGLIERRRDQRKSVEIAAFARWELSERCVPVQILDVSPGGFALRVPEPVHQGARILLTVSDDVSAEKPVMARTLWATEQDGEHLAGCGFVSKAGYPDLRQKIHSLHGRTDDALTGRRHSNRYVLALFGGVLASYAWLFYQLWRRQSPSGSTDSSSPFDACPQTLPGSRR